VSGVKFVRLHKPLGTPTLLNLDNVDYFELDSQDSVVANLTNGDRGTLREKLAEVEHICVVSGCASQVTTPPALKPPPSKVHA
jgi:hypothetical protein